MRGWRARLGILVPSGIVVTEPELNKMSPEGVSCHYHRVYFRGGGIEKLRRAEKGIDDAVRLILHTRPSAIALAGTGVSFAGGYGYDQMLIKKMKELTGSLPTTTTSTSVIDALRKLKVTKVSMAMPYLEEVAKAAVKFVEDSGIQVLNMKYLDIKGPIHNLSEEIVYRTAKEVDTADSEAVFISCVGWPSIEVIEALECDLQKPVISSNQATMWNLLRMANINDKIEGYGQLLSRF
jgi:maleate isomerase